MRVDTSAGRWGARTIIDTNLHKEKKKKKRLHEWSSMTFSVLVMLYHSLSQFTPAVLSVCSSEEELSINPSIDLEGQSLRTNSVIPAPDAIYTPPQGTTGTVHLRTSQAPRKLRKLFSQPPVSFLFFLKSFLSLNYRCQLWSLSPLDIKFGGVAWVV